MILPWMLYAGAVALLLGGAAACAETVARARGAPARGVWMGALLGSALLPPAAALLPLPAPFRAAAPGSMPPVPAAEAASEGWLAPAALLARAADPWLLAGWGLASAAVLAAVAASCLRLARSRREWSFRRVEGHGVWASRDVGPAVVGFLRGRIVLPEWVLEWDAGRRGLVLAHEDEHLRARDPGLLLGAVLLLAAFPWNAALWWQWRRLREAVEMDCDLRVLARGLDPAAYSRVLVEVTEHGHAHRLAVAAVSRPSSFLERRIRHMLEPRTRRWTLRAAGTTLFSGVLVLAACQVDRPRQSLVPTTGPTFSTQGGAAAPPVAVAGTGAITGVVLDASRRPVEGARVEVANAGAVSSSDGSFRLIRIPAGEHTLRAESAGRTLSQRVVVKAGETVTVRFEF